MKQEIIIEDAFRTDNVDGAIVTSMGLVTREKDGGMSAFIEVDDEKGLVTYNLMVKGDIAGIPDANDLKKWRIPQDTSTSQKSTKHSWSLAISHTLTLKQIHGKLSRPLLVKRYGLNV
jgi:hypothetical protein